MTSPFPNTITLGPHKFFSPHLITMKTVVQFVKLSSTIGYSIVYSYQKQ